MLKRFFSRLRSPKKNNSKRKSNKKINYFWQSRKGKIGIGISAVILVATVVLFSSQIDNLLRLWGIKAQNPMGNVTIQVDPDPGVAYPNQPEPDNIGNFNITIKPEQETWWVAQGGDLIDISIERIYVELVNPEVAPYIENADAYMDYSGDFPGLNILEGQPPLFFTDDTWQSVALAIRTLGPLPATTQALFVVNAIGVFNSYNSSGEQAPEGTALGIPVPFRLILDAGAPPLAGDFSVTITEPESKERTVDAGVQAQYTIEIAPIDGFSGEVTLSIEPDDPYFNEPEAISGVLLPPSVMLSGGNPEPVTLIVNTIDTLDHPVTVNFIITGTGNDLFGNVLRHSDDGILNIEPLWNFAVAATFIRSSANIDDVRVVPGGSITHEVAVIRMNGWNGDVEILDTWSADPGLNDKIESVTFYKDGIEDDFIFDEGSSVETKEMIIVFKDDALAHPIMTLILKGEGDLDEDGNIDDVVETKTANVDFEIVSFTITVIPRDDDGYIGVVPAGVASLDVQYDVIINLGDSDWGAELVDISFLLTTDLGNFIGIDSWYFDEDILSMSELTMPVWRTILHINTNINISPPEIKFIVTGTSIGEIYLADYTTKFSREGDGTLLITGEDFFFITLDYNDSTAHQADTAVPLGTITYDVTLHRLGGWDEQVDLTNNLLTNPTWVDQIGDAVFGKDFFAKGSGVTDATTLTITIKDIPDETNVIDINNFIVTGTYNAPLPADNIVRTATKTFSIIDFRIEVELTDLTVEYNYDDGIPTYVVYPNQADTVRLYQITIRPINGFSGRVTLSFAENNNSDVPIWNDVVGTITWDNPDSDASKSTLAVDGFDVVTGITMSILDFAQEPVGLYRNLDFTITGIDQEDLSLSYPGKQLVDGTFLLRDDIGRIQVKGTPIAPDYNVSIIYKDSTSDPDPDPLHIFDDTAVPYGIITYTVRITRSGGWTGQVDVNIIGLNPIVVETTTFEPVFNSGASPEDHDLTIYIRNTSPASTVTFIANALGNVGGVDVPKTATASFRVLDYTITVGPQSVDPIIEPYSGEVTYNVTAAPLNGYMGLIGLLSNLVANNGITGYSFDKDTLDSSSGNSDSTIMRLTLTDILAQIRNFKVFGTDANKLDRDGVALENDGDGVLVVTAPSIDPTFSLAITWPTAIPPAIPEYRANPGESGNFYTITVTPNDGFGMDPLGDTVTLNHTIPVGPANPVTRVDFVSQITGLPITEAVFYNSNPQDVWLYIETLAGTSDVPPIFFDVTGRSDDYNPQTDKDSAWLFIDNWPNYRLSLLPPAQSVVAGADARYRILVDRDPSYTDNIDLSLSNYTGTLWDALLVDDEYHFEDSAGNNRGLTITVVNGEANPWIVLRTDPNLLVGIDNETFEVAGTGGSAPGPHTAVGTLTITIPLRPTFTVALYGDTVGDLPIHNVLVDGSATYTVEVTPIDEFIGRVNLNHNLTDNYIDQDNTGFAGNIDYIDFTDPNDPTPKTIVLTVDSILASDSDHNPILFVVDGQSPAYGGLGPIYSNEGTFNIITIPNFYLELIPNTQMALREETADYTLNLIRQNGFSDGVDLTREFDIALINTLIIGGGVTRFEPSVINQSLSVEVTSFDNAAAVDTIFTIKGNDASGGILDEKSASATLQITNFEIQIRGDNSRSVIRGQDYTYTIDLLRENGFDRGIVLTYSIDIGFMVDFDTDPEFPGGSNTYTFPANIADQFTTLTFSTDINANLETVPFDVIGTDSVDIGFSGQTREDHGDLTILDNNPGTPDFTLVVTPDSQTVEPGGSTSYAITITKLNGFDEIIVLSTDLQEDHPTEIRETRFTASSSTPGEVILTVFTTEVRNSTVPITFSVFGTADTIERSDSADLIIYKPTVIPPPPPGPVTPPGPDPVTPPIPPVEPPVEPPKEPEIEEPALPSTGPDIWMWLIALLLISSIGFQELNTKRPE